MNLAEQVREKIASLADALTTAHPRMPLLLKEIHTHLRADPEIVTLLDEDQIQIVVKGLIKQTNTELAAAVLKSTKKVSMKNITTADL
jgi:hypothetical protein